MLNSDKQFLLAERRFALTAPQIPVWLDQSLYPEKQIYNSAQTLTLRTALDLDRFIATLNRVVTENDALRLRFVESDGEIFQQVVSDVSVNLEFCELSAERHPEIAATDWIEKILRKPLGATDFPLFQFALAKVATDRFLWLQKYHHLIIDGIGRQLVAARVARVYDALSADAEPPPASNGSYITVAKVAEDQYLASDSFAADEVHWRTRLIDLPEPLVQADAHLSEKSRSGRMARLAYDLSLEASDALRVFARRQGSTVFKVILCVTWSCLSRLYRKPDLVFGVPLANRKGADARCTVGQFAKVMPFRPRLDPAMTFADALSTLDIDLSNDLEHQRFPFHNLNGVLRPHRRGTDGLYDVVVNSQRMDYEFSFGGASVTCANCSAIFFVPWSITAFEYTAGDAIHIVIEYDPGRISSEEANRFLRSFREILRSAPKNATVAIGRLPMVSAEESVALMRRGQGKRVSLPNAATLPMLLAHQAARCPNATALLCGEERLTYTELYARVDRLTRQLVALGVGPDTLVGISLPRTVVLIVAILAVHDAGGAYLSLDPGYPRERLGFMVEDSNTKIILTDRARAALLSETGAQLLLLDDELPPEDAQELPSVQAGNGVGPSNLAYVLYTSGSTGRPNGVAVTHGAAVNLVLSLRSLVSDEDVAGVLFATSVNFDISVYEIFLPLACGGAIILVDTLFDLTTAPARDDVRLINTVPSMMNTFLKQSSIPVGVRLVNLAGEVLPRGLASRIFAERTDIRLFNLYGPTEATVYSTWSMVDRNDRRSPPIGVPIGNTELYVLDEFRQLVPEGGIGELWIGGMGLSRGYLNRYELTQQRFVPNPFGEGRIYKTGDLVGWLSDGQLGYFGRIDDHQVKIRGHRIELGEIESVLELQPTVRDAVVVVREDAPGDQRLVAYVIPASSSSLLINELREFLKGRLPARMIPSAFVMLDAFPLLPNGKLDRSALPLPDAQTPESFESYVAPRTPTEEALADIWCEVLKSKQVGIYDNFFDCGGHSLLAMRVVARVSNTLAVELSLRTFFENPTIISLADQIEKVLRLMKGNGGALGSQRLVAKDKLRSGYTAPPAAPAPELLLTPDLLRPLGKQKSAIIKFLEDAVESAPVSRGVGRALSFAQERLWFLNQLESDSAVYNIPMMLRLEGALDESVLRRSLEEVIRRHESLRTRFEAVEGKPVQIIEPIESLEMPFVELNELPEEEREAEVTRLCREEAQRPFNLERDLMLRAKLFRLQPTRHVLFLNLHHIASDGWSVAVLLGELGSHYQAFFKGQSSPLAELPVQYSDFAVWQRDWLQGEVLDQQVCYWREQLAGAPALLELPTDRPRPARQSYRGATERTVFPNSLLKPLKALSQRGEASLFMTLLAAFQILLGRYSGQEDITVGSPIAGRNRVELEGLIGFFVNTVVVRGDLSGNPTFGELLRRVRETTLAACAHQDLPFEKLVEELQPERTLSRTPLFQVLFTLQNITPAPSTLGGLNLDLQFLPSATSKFDLSMLLSEEADGLAAKVEYRTDLFDRDTITRLLNHFRILLEGVVANPDTHIRELPVLTEAERHQLLIEWNNTHTACPTKTVAELFAEQAAQTPNAVAVVFGQKLLTYAELNADANQMAHYLKSFGVGPESLVACCMERSSELIVILLGILKAGGAYVALDPNTPSTRLQWILEDAKPTVIVVQSARQKNAIESLALVGERWRGSSPNIVCLEQDAEVVCHQSAANSYSGAISENQAYVCFTSGSTGRPKGVSIPHRGIVRLVKNANYISIRSSDVFLQLAPLSFDASTFEIWGCLLNGARLVVPQPQTRSLAELGLDIREHGVSILWLTAGLFNLMVDHELDSLKDVRQLLVGGDVLSTAHVRKALGRLGEGRLINGYGPTENTTFTCWHPITRCSADRHSIPIGRPISNTQCFILDGNLRPVPIGVRGELFAGGDGLARGYWNDQELTAEKFISNPLRPGALLYRTGDFARYLSDGKIEFLGRVDHQVKIRGFRVELGEIETVLRLHPAVRECAVVVVKDAPDDKKFVAYVRPADASAEVSKLRRFLKERLPTHMVPSAFVFVDGFPLTANGKIDRKALPLPESMSPGIDESYVAPRTRTENVLVCIWCEVFNLGQVGVHDNFFELGGHSLMAIRLIGKINRTLKVTLGVAELFQNPTIEQMARVIDGRLPKSKRSSAVISMQEGRAEPSVYFIYAGPDEFRLAQLMGEGRSVFGIESPWPLAWRNAAASNETSALPTVEQMVAPYVAALSAHTRSSPCVLAGFSFGGLMAFEAAHQIQGRGGKVELVLLIDSLAKHRTPYQAAWHQLRQDWKQVANGVSADRIWPLFKGVGKVIILRMFGKEIKWLWSLFRGAEPLGELTTVFDEEGVPLHEGLLFRSYREAVKNYRPRCLDCRGVLFRSADERHAGTDGALGWEKLFTGGLEIVPVTGNHVSMVRQAPHNLTLAREMNAALNRFYQTYETRPNILACES